MEQHKKVTASTAAPGGFFKNFAIEFWYFFVLGTYHIFVRRLAKELLHKVPEPDYSTLQKRTGETVVITGGTKGIGAAVVKKLLQLDFTVIMGARDLSEGLDVIRKIREETRISTGVAKCCYLDLKSFKSIQDFAKNVLSQTERIDMLINNAGISRHPWEITEDNVEVHFQVNYLGHFLLTELLLPKIKETGKMKQNPCRIVNVTSFLHYAAIVKNIPNSDKPRTFSGTRAYCETKLCQVLTTKYLNKKLVKENCNVRANCVHPGVIGTNIWDRSGLVGKCMKTCKRILRSVDKGAEEVIFTATSPQLDYHGGSYIQNTKIKKPLKKAEDEKLQEFLWDMSQNRIKEFLL